MYLTDFIVVFGLLLIYAAIGVYYRLTGNKQQTINVCKLIQINSKLFF